MKFKDNSSEKGIVEEVIEIAIPSSEENTSIKKASEDAKDTYMHIIKTHLDIVQDSIKVIRQNFNKLCGCGGESDD